MLWERKRSLLILLTGCSIKFFHKASHTTGHGKNLNFENEAKIFCFCWMNQRSITVYKKLMIMNYLPVSRIFISMVEKLIRCGNIFHKHRSCCYGLLAILLLPRLLFE